MALTWPSKKVALDIIDNPGHHPLDKEGWTIVRVTNAELEDYESCRRIMDHIAELLGSSAPEAPDWEEKNRRFHQALLARSA